MNCPLCGGDFPDGVAFCPQDGSALLSETVRAAGDLVGEFIADRYRILEKIGTGGMGVVYRARQKLLDRDVALKVLPLALASDHGAQRRFFNEARAISKLRHRNIITLFDFGRTQQGYLYIAMEFVEGLPLSRLIRKGPIAYDLALHIVVSLFFWI